MLPEDDLAKIRFDMSRVPEPGGQPGDYEEKLSQWFLARISHSPIADLGESARGK